MSYLHDISPHNSLRPPHWQMAQLEHLRELASRSGSPHEAFAKVRYSFRLSTDAKILAEYLRLQDTDRDETTRMDRFVNRHPNHVTAYRLYSARNFSSVAATLASGTRSSQTGRTGYSLPARSLATILESFVLAGVADPDVASYVGVSPEVVRLYKSLFFDVAERLRSPGWIFSHVLLPAIEQARGELLALQAAQAAFAGQADPAATGNAQRLAGTMQFLSSPFFDPTNKFYAYYGGPVMARFCVAMMYDDHPPKSFEDLQGWLDAQFTARLRVRSTTAAGTFEVNRYNVMQLIGVHAELVKAIKETDRDTERDVAIRSQLDELSRKIKWTKGNTDDGAAAMTSPFDKMAVELTPEQEEGLRQVGAKAVYSLPGKAVAVLGDGRAVEYKNTVFDDATQKVKDDQRQAVHEDAQPRE